ncbi:MAG TPA: hypothetical protein VGK74_19060 [Symbiobacteriaceae bacterium]|jgi:hypothetical protein
MRKRLTALMLGLLLLTACSGGGTIQPYAKAATDPGYFTGLWAHLAARLQLEAAKPVFLKEFTLAFDAGGTLQSGKLELVATGRDSKLHQIQVDAAGGKWRRTEVPVKATAADVTPGEAVFRRLDQAAWSDLLQRLGQPSQVTIRLTPDRKCAVSVEGGGRRWPIDTCAPAVALLQP